MNNLKKLLPQIPVPVQPWLSVAEIARDFLFCTPNSVYRLIKVGTLPALRIGKRQYRVLYSDIATYIYTLYNTAQQKGEDINLRSAGEAYLHEIIQQDRFSGKAIPYCPKPLNQYRDPWELLALSH